MNTYIFSAVATFFQVKDLKSKIDIGNINEAEDSLFEMLKHKTQDSLLIGLLFYSYLNEKDSKFLNEHNNTEFQQASMIYFPTYIEMFDNIEFVASCNVNSRKEDD